ncbi:MAG: amidohydrolase family protein [Candidatus Sumerlaeota bacterium]|nr:amidohydrolase family protein [Candidatus Sumerlaeota bacterium]
MRFFDANTFIGAPIKKSGWPPVNAEGLVRELDRSGIERALVWHIVQLEGPPLTGNDLLTKELRPFRDRLVPCWALLPTHTGEIGTIREFLDRAGKAGVRALRVHPAAGRFSLRPADMGNLMIEIGRRRIPLVYSIAGNGGNWDELHAFMEWYPDLTLIIADIGVWPCDRRFRPFLDRYSRVRVEISQYLAPGGIEGIVAQYGAERLLFATGFPAIHHGGQMLMVKHAQIPEKAKELIAFGNLERLLKEAQL